MKDWQLWKQAQWLMRQFGGAIAFYTVVPFPANWALELTGIARWAPLIGLLIGGCLGLGDELLRVAGVPALTRSTLIVVLWIALTGGLHLDGAMDTADGLAVPDRERRLLVMVDSHTGAFGVISAIALFSLKITALSDLVAYRWLALMAAAGWGRWGQLLAISRYPYLKPAGKGAMHKATIQPGDLLLGLGVLLGFSSLTLLWSPWIQVLGIIAGGSAISWSTAAWLNHRLGGHTGDTYGAVVEWSEALILCLFTALLNLKV